MTDAPRLRVSTVIRRELTFRRDCWAVNELDEEFGRIWAAEYAWAATCANSSVIESDMAHAAG
ncbi:MAG: hypothetical protein ACXWMR_16040 [Gemmatimonadaceae bacterium]